MWPCAMKLLENLSKKCQLNHFLSLFKWSHRVTPALQQETYTTKATKLIKLMDRGNGTTYFKDFLQNKRQLFMQNSVKHLELIDL